MQAAPNAATVTERLNFKSPVEDPALLHDIRRVYLLAVPHIDRMVLPRRMHTLESYLINYPSIPQ